MLKETELNIFLSVKRFQYYESLDCRTSLISNRERVYQMLGLLKSLVYDLL